MTGQLYQMLCELGKGYDKEPAFLYRENGDVRQVYYPEFLRTAMERCRAFGGLPQTRIGLWAYNSYEWMVNALGILLAGKTLVLLDVNLREHELWTLAGYTDVELIIADAERLAGERFSEARIPIRLPGSIRESDAGKTDFEAAGEGELICFTSGTSSSARGVVIPAGTLAEAIAAGVAVFSGKVGERFYVPIPYYHIYGFTQFFHILKRGGTICIGQSKYLKKEMECFKPQVAMLVPSMIQYLLKQDALKAPLYAVVTGGGMLSDETAAQVHQRGFWVDNGYGLSETLGEISIRTKEKSYHWQKPQEGVRFILSSEGEIGVYLPFHMKEYYKKPENTAAALDKEKHLLWTGDAGEIDGDGCIRIRGRLRDTIVLENGEKVHAEDMDAQIAGLRGIEDGAVISLNGRIGAVFVKKPGNSEEEILEELKRLNRQKAPCERIVKVWFRKEPLPRTAIGKLKRFELEMEYRGEEP